MFGKIMFEKRFAKKKLHYNKFNLILKLANNYEQFNHVYYINELASHKRTKA